MRCLNKQNPKYFQECSIFFPHSKCDVKQRVYMLGRAAEPVPPKGQSRWLLKHIEIQNKINAMRDALLGSDVRE